MATSYQPSKFACTAVFIACFHVQITLHDLGIPLPHDDCFGKIKNSYTKSVYCSISDDYGVNANKVWMNGDCFYT